MSWSFIFMWEKSPIINKSMKELGIGMKPMVSFIGWYPPEKFPVLPSYAFSFVRNSIPTLGLIPMRIIRSCKGPFSVSDFSIAEKLL